MTMSEEEARRFVAQLQNGKRFATRFQEDEWGLDFLGNGRYRKWSRRNRQDEVIAEETVLTEAELLALLMHSYRYDVMAARLQPLRGGGA